MKTIEIDNEVLSFLKSSSTWEDKNPNDVLRRLLDIKNKTGSIISVKQQKRSAKTKKPKANLTKLIESGLLNEGQTLYFRCPDGLSKKYESTVTADGLICQGEKHTMSRLVAKILRDEGFSIPSEAYRGPAYWYNAEGKSVKDLWAQYLSDNDL